MKDVICRFIKTGQYERKRRRRSPKDVIRAREAGKKGKDQVLDLINQFGEKQFDDILRSVVAGISEPSPKAKLRAMQCLEKLISSEKRAKKIVNDIPIIVNLCLKTVTPSEDGRKLSEFTQGCLLDWSRRFGENNSQFIIGARSCSNVTVRFKPNPVKSQASDYERFLAVKQEIEDDLERFPKIFHESIRGPREFIAGPSMADYTTDEHHDDEGTEIALLDLEFSALGRSPSNDSEHDLTELVAKMERWKLFLESLRVPGNRSITDIIKKLQRSLDIAGFAP